MAVGADAGDVLRMVLRQGATLTAFGVAAGLLGAAALGRVMAGQLYGVGSLDPMTFVAVALGRSTVAMIATYVPAARAAGIDPAMTLQSDGR